MRSYPSYERGIIQTKIEDVILMINKFKLVIEDVAKELNISVELIKKQLK